MESAATSKGIAPEVNQDQDLVAIADQGQAHILEVHLVAQPEDIQGEEATLQREKEEVVNIQEAGLQVIVWKRGLRRVAAEATAVEEARARTAIAAEEYQGLRRIHAPDLSHLSTRTEE